MSYFNPTESWPKNWWKYKPLTEHTSRKMTWRGLVKEIYRLEKELTNRSEMKTIRTIAENSQQWKKCPIGTLLRVRDEDARRVVEKHEAEYVSKAEWKKLRDNETNNNKEANNA